MKSDCGQIKRLEILSDLLRDIFNHLKSEDIKQAIFELGELNQAIRYAIIKLQEEA